MAITVICANPQGLLNSIKSAIKDGAIDTWIVDADGDFSHSPEQWKYQAWLRARVEQEKLVFNILSRRDQSVSKVAYGIYHGRFIEMLLNHFDKSFERATASALPLAGDIVNPPKPT